MESSVLYETIMLRAVISLSEWQWDHFWNVYRTRFVVLSYGEWNPLKKGLWCVLRRMDLIWTVRSFMEGPGPTLCGLLAVWIRWPSMERLRCAFHNFLIVWASRSFNGGRRCAFCGLLVLGSFIARVLWSPCRMESRILYESFIVRILWSPCMESGIFYGSFIVRVLWSHCRMESAILCGSFIVRALWFPCRLESWILYGSFIVRVLLSPCRMESNICIMDSGHF